MWVLAWLYASVTIVDAEICPSSYLGSDRSGMNFACNASSIAVTRSADSTTDIEKYPIDAFVACVTIPPK